MCEINYQEETIMPKSISEEYPELFHYTNSVGLSGIIQSQTLWATHYAYLNDAEEIKHFLVLRLPNILHDVMAAHLDEFVKQAQENQFLIDKEGGIEIVIERAVKEMSALMENSLLTNRDGKEPLAEPYIASFCATNDDRVKKHGLLSQWRGYGRDGGYAIVFDTAGLSQLLTEAGKKCVNGGDLFGGDVVYSSDPDQKIMEEFGGSESVIKNYFSAFLKADGSSRELEKQMYPALTQCACRYKHWGFKEENEVRVIAIPNNKEVCDLARADGTIINEMPRGHFIRSGTPVPFIDLFKGVTSVPTKCLPIKRIIVGPHPNKKERIRAVEMLLDQYGIKADVSASEIPYLG